MVISNKAPSFIFILLPLCWSRVAASPSVSQHASCPRTASGTSHGASSSLAPLAAPCCPPHATPRRPSAPAARHLATGEGENCPVARGLAFLPPDPDHASLASPPSRLDNRSGPRSARHTLAAALELDTPPACVETPWESPYPSPLARNSTNSTHSPFLTHFLAQRTIPTHRNAAALPP